MVFCMGLKSLKTTIFLWSCNNNLLAVSALQECIILLLMDLSARNSLSTFWWVPISFQQVALEHQCCNLLFFNQATFPQGYEETGNSRQHGVIPCHKWKYAYFPWLMVSQCFCSAVMKFPLSSSGYLGVFSILP